MPAGGPHKIGLEFSSTDVNYADMLADFVDYNKYFFN